MAYHNALFWHFFAEISNSTKTSFILTYLTTLFKLNILHHVQWEKNLNHVFDRICIEVAVAYFTKLSSYFCVGMIKRTNAAMRVTVSPIEIRTGYLLHSRQESYPSNHDAGALFCLNLY